MSLPLRIVFFDGQCPFCIGWVKFLLDRDGSDRLRFASLQSGWTRDFFEEQGLEHPGMGSVLVWDGERLHTQSEAAVVIAEALPGIWRLGRYIRSLPEGLRNGAYKFIAERRIDWFGQKTNCWLPKEDDRRKFLDLSDPVYKTT